jgi:hypothetical protein
LLSHDSDPQRSFKRKSESKRDLEKMRSTVKKKDSSLARDIDVQQVSFVINYDLPTTKKNTSIVSVEEDDSVVREWRLTSSPLMISE